MRTAGSVAERLRFEWLDRNEQRRRSRAFLALMRRRHSVRHFSKEPVPRELVENALRVAATAPSGANQRPWKFVVVRDPAVKAAIRVAAEREEELLYRERATTEYDRLLRRGRARCDRRRPLRRARVAPRGARG